MKTPLDKKDKIWEAVSLLLLLANALLLLFTLPQLPDNVPIHFDGSGRANGWGSKYLLWTSSGIMLFVYVLLTLISFKPGLYRYRMTNNNLAEQYRLTSKMTRTVKAFILLAFIVMTVFMLQTAQSRWREEIPFMFLVFFAAVVTPCLYYAVKLMKAQ